MTIDQAPRKATPEISRFLMYAASPLLVAYVVLLLVTTAISQQNLREAADQQSRLELEKQAVALSYFFSERRSDIENLSRNRSLEVYFSNQALGMSMEYGLRASILMMRKRFQEVVDRKKIAADPIYRRLLFVGCEGEVLIDVGAGRDTTAPWVDEVMEDVDTPEVLLLPGEEKDSLLFFVHYVYKGADSGIILAELDHSLIIEQFLHHRNGSARALSILTESDSSGNPDNDGSIGREESGGQSLEPDRYRSQSSIPIPETPLVLRALGSLDQSGGYLTSRWYLVSLSVLAVLVLVSVALGVRTGSRNLALHVRFEESKRQSDLLTHLAHHDPLTGLPNRLLLTDRLQQLVKRAERNALIFAVVFLDLDRFKNINDSLGHTIGDELLCQVATRLLSLIRAEDTLARISGDEFVILLENVRGVAGALKVVEKIAKSFAVPFPFAEREIRVTSSVGVSLYPDDGENAATLPRNADSAMYRAKDDGRNTHQFYSDELTRLAFEKMTIENALRGALDRNEFYLVYQPQVCLHSRRFIDVEALLRWDNPELGPVPPTTFIPLSEQNGLINEIGAWVLRVACRQAVAWLSDRLPLEHLAVNVSGNQMQRFDFEKEVKVILEETGLAPDKLELEVIEGCIMQNLDHAINQISALRELGVSFAIDDFGTGYSSMSYLKRLPISKLKIDRSFVRDIPDDKDDMVIAAAIIGLGKSLGLRVVAEGVENRQQAVFLTEKGCDEAQGYFFGKPARTLDTGPPANVRGFSGE